MWYLDSDQDLLIRYQQTPSAIPVTAELIKPEKTWWSTEEVSRRYQLSYRRLGTWFVETVDLRDWCPEIEELLIRKAADPRIGAWCPDDDLVTGVIRLILSAYVASRLRIVHSRFRRFYNEVIGNRVVFPIAKSISFSVGIKWCLRFFFGFEIRPKIDSISLLGVLNII